MNIDLMKYSNESVVKYMSTISVFALYEAAYSYYSIFYTPILIIFLCKNLTNR